MMKMHLGPILVSGLLLASTLSLAPPDVVVGANSDYERVEVPEAGLALSFPSDWSIEMRMERDDSKLPDGLTDPGSAQALVVLSAVSGMALVYCKVTWFEDMPMSAEAHADLVAEDLSSDPRATVEVTAVGLPAGDATRVLYHTPDGNALADGYMLGSGADHYELRCLDSRPFEDDFLPVAESIELLGPEPPDEPPPPQPVPEGSSAILSLDALTGFSSVVEVADGLLMSADCELALWAELDDGTFREWLSCDLSEAPIDDPEFQGAWPVDFISISGGACEWISDYWSAGDGSETWATSYELTVTPEGRVFGTSLYGAEMLDCSGP